MQALILAGGEGTRLQPLTSNVPKPVVPLVDRPFIAYMLEWLRRHGIEDVIMSCGFLADGVRDVLGDGAGLGVRLRYVEEPEPLGTGGAVKFAEDLLEERFLMLNGDILCDLDLAKQIALHEANGARATLALVEVEDPSAYGLVRLSDDGSVREFVEKPNPEQIDTNRISAGAYVLEREVLGLLEAGQRASIERDVFPRLVGDGLYGWVGSGYWLDIGTPERYLQGATDILEGNVETPVTERLGPGGVLLGAGVDPQGEITAPAIVGACSVVAGGAHLRRCVLGEGVTVGEGATVDSAVVLDGVEIGPGALVRDCIICAGARVGADARVDGWSIVGDGVEVEAQSTISGGARIFPEVSLPDGTPGS